MVILDLKVDTLWDFDQVWLLLTIYDRIIIISLLMWAKSIRIPAFHKDFGFVLSIK
jgi:hypothetical protein